MNELVANHREFVAFVERRVRDRAIAENIVQDAVVKGPGTQRRPACRRVVAGVVLPRAAQRDHRPAPASAG